MTKRLRQVVRLTLLLLAGCANSSSRAPTPLPEAALPPRAALAEPPPAPEREFRGLWVATFQNLDWPSHPGLDAGQQKAELLAILDRAVLLHLNAILLQVRPCCDALYDSKIEPWSAFLTGKMGLAPKPYYDPLAFAVAECHRRGLELHAWFNPFRVRSRDDKTPAAKNFVANTRPELVRSAGEVVMLDPSDPRSRRYSLDVIMDVVRRYDIDGVHLDDYFYPYPAKGYKPADFPDDVMWQLYQKTRGKLSRDDWRRNNINTFVYEAYDSIKKEKPWVKFGISPFGIWRPGHPAEVTAALDSYDALFADSQAWLANGWVDYLSPQLYWPTDEKEHSFAALLQWWSAQNTRHRHLWPGMQADEWPGFKGNPAAETAKEIELTRGQPGASGDVLWRAAFVMRNPGVAAALARTYPAPALVPASPWLGGLPAGKPLLAVRKTAREISLAWKPAGGAPVWQWFLQAKFGGQWRAEILPAAQTNRLFVAGGAAVLPQAVAITAVTRVGSLSPPAVCNLTTR
jgi:uncharacterized lipoprotein YddW (UPF0748 family)